MDTCYWYRCFLLLLLTQSLFANGQRLQQATLSDNIISENQAAGTLVGTFSPATASFSLVASVPENALFSIINRELVTTAPLNFEAVTSYTLQVNVVFQSSLGEDSAATQAFVIRVEDANDPPVVTGQLPLTTVENQPFTLALANLSASDEDADDTYPEGFTLRAEAGDNYTVVGLTVTPTPDYDGVLAVPVVVNDGEADSERYPLTVTVQALPRFSLAEEYAVSEDFAEPERVSVTPENPEQAVTYDISPGPEEVDFATLTADNSNGIYLFTALPDKNGEEEFVITATSDEQNTFAQEFIFRVNAVNDAPQFVGVQGNNQTVEAQAGPVSVPDFATNVAPGPATATDESSQAINFEVTTSDNSLFAQLPTVAPNGTLSYQPADDNIGTAQVSVVLRDAGSEVGPNTNVSLPQAFEVEVVAPLSPTDFDLNNLTVPENQPITEVVGRFTESGNYRFDGGPNDQLFRIDDRNLFARQPFNFENPDQQELVIRVERRFGFLNLQREYETFTIRVLNVEEPPTGITLTANTIAEGAAVGTRVGFLTAQGGAPEVPVSFALVNGPEGENNGQFTIVGNELRINQVPDFETTPQYSVRVQATGDGVSPAQNFIIQVVNAEEPPTDILLSSAAVDENLPPGTAVGTLSVTGGSAVPITYTLGGSGAAAFAVSDGQLLTQAPFNFEDQASYTLTITATGDGPFSEDFTIAVGDVEEPPTDIVLGSNSINEGAPVGSLVGTLGASGGEAVTTYELVNGNGSGGNGNFTITGNQLLTNAVFDFETQAVYSVRVRATGDGSFDKVFEINVIDQPDPPTDIALSSTTVDENQPVGTVVGTLSATGGEGPYTFTLPGARGNNGAFSIVGNELRTDQKFNFENTPTRTVVVVASNADGPFEETIALTIGNLPEPPTEITLSSTTIRENEPIGTTVGALTATGGSGGDVVFTLVGGQGSRDNERFIIEDGQLKNNVSLNFEFRQTYQVRIRATRDGSFTQSFEIVAINVEEPPTAIILSSTTVSENRNAGAEVGTISTEGGEGPVTFALVGEGNDNENFRIENRRLLTNFRFDREERPSYRILIRATGDGTIASDFTITIEDVNEAPVLSNVERTFLDYAEGEAAKIITQGIEVDEPEGEDLVEAEVFFANSTYVPGEDELSLDQGGIQDEWDPETGRLTIAGPLSANRMEQALRAVRYNNLREVNPTASTRRVTFVVNDGTNLSNTQERFIRISNSNIPPVLADVPLSTREDVPAALTQENFVTAYGGDEDGTGFSGTIFVLTLPERGALSVGERILTDDDLGRQGFEVDLTATSLTYTPPANYAGADRFKWTAQDNEDEPGISAEVVINVLPENDPPLITAPPTLNVEENNTVPLSGLSVAEPDGDRLLVTLAIDQGTLTIADAARSEVTFEQGTGEEDSNLTFQGTLIAVNDALASLIYNPVETVTTASLTLSVSDAPGNADNPLSDQVSVALTITPQNDNPVLSAIEPDALLFVENGEPIPITDSLQVSDEEGDPVVAAVVSIDSGYTPEDVLAFESTPAISANFDQGVLTLTGTASVVDYQAALRRVTYQNTSDQPTTDVRTIRFEVTDGTGGQSNALTREVVVEAVEDTLQVVDLETTPLYFSIGRGPAVVSRSVRLEDPDSETLDRLVISLDPETYVAADDSLGVRVGGGLTADWNDADGVLTLAGTAPLATYQEALRTLVYFNRNVEAEESDRTLQIQGFSGETASNVAVRPILLINNEPPVVGDVAVVVLSSTSYFFVPSLFQPQYNDPDQRPTTDGFLELQITTLPTNGTLLLDGVPLTTADLNGGLVLSTDVISSLSYVSNQGFLGEDQFAWNASDGADFAEEAAQVLITVSDLRVNLGEDVETCQSSDLLELTVDVQGGTPPYRYRWSANGEALAATIDRVAVSPTETTTYRVEVTDAEELTVADSVQVVIIDCPDQELDIPNAFTPNGDGDNDLWEVGNLFTYERSTVEIYDRYGHRLFRAEEDGLAWDGRYQGKELPVGTYYYVIVLNEGSTSYKGSVTILR